MDKLIAIITGPEHNGTTYFKRLLESLPDVYSGFETGFLLDENFEKCNPWNSWIYESKEHWGVKKNINFMDKNLTFNEKYQLLFDFKATTDDSDEIQKLIRNSKYLIDKTPKYFYFLPKIVKNLNNYDIPILIVLKDLKQHYISLCIKRKFSLQHFIEKIKNSIIILRWIKNNPNLNMHLFEYKDIVDDKLYDKIVSKIKVKGEICFDNFLKKIPENVNFKDKEWGESINQITLPKEISNLEEYNKLLFDLKVK